MGGATIASGAASFAGGANSTAEGDYSFVMGKASHALGENSTALSGGKTAEDAANALAAGEGAEAKLADSVALGSGAIADRAKGQTGWSPATAGTGAAWVSTHNAVAVGSDTVTRQIIGVAAGTNDTDAVNVAQLKSLAEKVTEQVEDSTVHYYSAKSDKTGAGTNYANDGAKAQDSIVLGISSTSEGINSMVIGNNNTLTGEKNGRNNSIVVGQSLTVEGSYNAVFGTDYHNYDNKLTHVAGEQNTVLGVGNLVGYTAEQDPNDPTKWIYTKVGTKGSDQNVAVGLTNTANGGSVVVGTSSTVENLGSSFGHANTVIGSGNGGGQWGLALGNKLTAKGEMALAIGNETTAEGDWTVAIGSESSTAKNFDVAMGYQANASGGQSIAMGTVSAASGRNAIAMGTYAKATVDGGVALGSYSTADTDAGVQGYDPSTNAASTQDDSIWKATLGAVSVGGGASNNTRQITNVAAGFADTDAVNVAQLKKARTEVEGADSITVTSKTGDDGQTIYTVTGTDKDTTYTAGDNITISADNVISATDTKVTAADLAVDAGKLNITVQDTAGNTVTGSVDLAEITAGVADGNTTYELSGKENENNTTTITLTDSDGNKNEVTVATKDTTLEGSTSGLTVEDGKLNLLVKDSAGNEVTGSVDLSDIAAGVDTNTTYELSGQENDDNTTTITLTGSDGKTSDVTVATKDTRNTVTAGANVQVDEKKNDDGSSNYTVSVVTDGKVEKDNAGIVTGGTVYAETRVEQDGNYIKAENTAGQNITALDNQVKQNAVDIANIDNRVTNLDSRVTNMDGRIDRGGAGAAALAGLHPLDFDPDDKWDFAAAYGNYQGAHAVAIGAYYRPNEDTMFSVGGSFNGGENMLNVGVSWKFGQKNQVSRSRVSMAKDMLAMKAQIEALTARLAAYEAGQAGQAVAAAPVAGDGIAFPDVPENHWAYRYVQTLAARGYLQGYPDGEFKGDRAMTRYEYAAIIYRALQNGAPTDGDMVRSVDEFGAELAKVQNIDRFRVDRISGADDDRYKVERVRVNDQDNEEQNDFRDVYGSQIGQ
ncbi:MAG: S-layer homology domain-containing protein [Veillonellaceae bacterium]|nr:S-layer homology domain-containing protein [Veillonellaceae bacterium]